MRIQKYLLIFVAWIFLLINLNAGFCDSETYSPIMDCSNLMDIDLGSNVTITSATIRNEIDNPIPGGSPVPTPPYCEVRGKRFYDPFIVKLPTEWNGRYYQVGNGGAAGTISISGIDSGLLKGYASAGASGGHDNQPPFPLFVWGYPPNDPAAQQKVNDYCYGSVHETSILAKQLIKGYYGIEPHYSYYNSCSTGGRQGLVEAQRYPEDFDGLLIGAPVHYLTRITQRGIWEAQAQLGDGAIPTEKLPLLADSVMKKCDSMDGLVDGLIDDPQKCNFNPLFDLPPCENDIDSSTCFTNAQRIAIKKIYDGTPGAATTPGEPYGSEAVAPVPAYLGGGIRSGWEGWVVGPPYLGLLLGAGFVQWIGLPPDGGGSSWNWITYDFNGPDPQMVIDHMSEKCDAIDPNLWPLKSLGKKIIHYDGWADQATGPYQSVEYYENVIDLMGWKNTKDFYKLYMIPGVAHCGGGAGCFDGGGDLDQLFSGLVDWVEKGIEPKVFIGHRGANEALGWKARTRPLCPYPEVARYLGRGSMDDAQNFVCVKTFPVRVKIEPETLKLGSRGVLTAFISFNEDLPIKDWEIISVVCEGAPAVISKPLKKGPHGYTYMAKFRREDLINITHGEEVTFTVTIITEPKWHHSPHHHKDKELLIAFEGSDTVKVLK